jgi:hypothetical protein
MKLHHEAFANAENLLAHIERITIKQIIAYLDPNTTGSKIDDLTYQNNFQKVQLELIDKLHKEKSTNKSRGITTLCTADQLKPSFAEV